MRDFKGMKRQRGRNRWRRRRRRKAAAAERQPGFRLEWSRKASRCAATPSTFSRSTSNWPGTPSSAGDRVLAESYLQHAEHYFRVVRAMQPTKAPAEILGRDSFTSGFDIDFEDEQRPGGGRGGRRRERLSAEQRQRSRRRERRRPAAARGERWREDRPRDDRPREDRQQRDNRDDRPRGDRFEGRGRDRWRDRDDRPRDDNRPGTSVRVMTTALATNVRAMTGPVKTGRATSVPATTARGLTAKTAATATTVRRAASVTRTAATAKTAPSATRWPWSNRRPRPWWRRAKSGPRPSCATTMAARATLRPSWAPKTTRAQGRSRAGRGGEEKPKARRRRARAASKAAKARPERDRGSLGFQAATTIDPSWVSGRGFFVFPLALSRRRRMAGKPDGWGFANLSAPP